MKEKKYIISEKELIHLIARNLELTQLECAGVDNWSWYGEGRREFLLEAIDGRLSEEEIDEDLDFKDVAKLDLQHYKKYKGE